MEVIKRNGDIVPFDMGKILKAIQGAFEDVDEAQVDNNVFDMYSWIESTVKDSGDRVPVEEIQDIVEEGLMLSGYLDVARAYIKYRYKHELERQTKNDSEFLSLISGDNDYWNKENSNKNAQLVTVQRDYLAGVASTDIARNFIFSKDIIKAHDAGFVHQHDMDYMAQNSLHNCFSADTEFVTSEGVKSFNDFYDGSPVVVRDKDGQWRSAVVHNFGKQILYTVTLQSSDNIEQVHCTRNHRWILADGSVTDNLQVGDVLYMPPSVSNSWKVESIEKAYDDDACDVWCVTEPATHSFTLASGIVTGNCELINLEDMLQNGTVINNVKINKPHRLSTAMTITTQIMASVAANSYGGETITLTHLAPFVRDSKNLIYKKYEESGFDKETCDKLTKIDLAKEVSDAVQTFNYQISTLFTLNGQAPFCSVFMYLNETDEYKEELAMLIEEFLHQRIKGMPNRQGIFVTQSFPKLLYTLEEDNVKPGTKYWYLTELAAECSSKRLVPDYISEKVMKKLKVDDNGDGHCFPPMGCRSFLSPYIDPSTNKAKFYGRFNCGVSSINLPDIAFAATEKCSGQEAVDEFFRIFDERLEISHRALQTRAARLSKTRASVAPILWMDGALARLSPDETLARLVHGGYSTISQGYVGLYDCVYVLTGHSHTTEDGLELGKKILQYMNDKCEQWKQEDNLGYGVYGTPAESLAFKFATKTRARYPERFQKIFGNKKYFENSFHVASFEKINPFTKIKIESQYQELSTSGMISYIECSDLSRNPKAIYTVLQYIYDNIAYCELNTVTSYCQTCGESQTIKVHKDEDGNTWWECDVCGERDHSKMNLSARTCGYIGTNFWNDGKTQEIASRYVHLDDHSFNERPLD